MKRFFAIQSLLADFSLWGKLMMGLLLVAGFTACSESEPEEPEFANWKERNDAYFDKVYKQAQANANSGDKKWKVIPAYTFTPEAAKHSYDNIVVEVLNEGTGLGCPLFTDTVRVHYEGRYMPTAHYAQGYRFDGSWVGDYNLDTMLPAKFMVGSTVEGFATALMQMHVGDRWKVYIPYPLAYGSNSSASSIPNCTTLIFDITMMAYWHPGTIVPDVK